MAQTGGNGAGAARDFEWRPEDEASPDDMLAEAEALLLADSRSASAQFQRAYALFLLGRLPECERELEDLCAANAGHANGWWLYAGVLRGRSGNRDPAVLNAFERAVAADAANLYVQAEYADVLRSLSRHQEARAIYEGILRPDACADDPLRCEAAFNLGIVLQVLGDTEAALAAFQTALALDPANADAAAMAELLTGGPADASAPPKASSAP